VPKEGDAFPSNKTYYEIPIAIQGRAFNEDGSLFYPDTREFFDGATAADPGFIPFTDLSPIWNPEFFGNMIMVNGNTWPVQTVKQRRYRLRFLNGCQSRFLILDFNQIPGVEVWAIGDEGGFLAAPVNLTFLIASRPAGIRARLRSGRVGHALPRVAGVRSRWARTVRAVSRFHGSRA
jgi:FtsP/CotA-like multicopper oxidase with cupredoxin domain